MVSNGSRGLESHVEDQSASLKNWKTAKATATVTKKSVAYALAA